MILKKFILNFTAKGLTVAVFVISALAQEATAAESAAGSYEVLDFLDKVPYWAVYIGLLLLFFLSIEAGFRLGRYKGPSSDAFNESRKAQASTILGAMLSLVAFLLAFTFGMAGSQYDTRRRLVVDHANAIGTTFLRADHMPEPHRSNIRGFLGDYVSYRHIESVEILDELKARSVQLEQKLWAEATAIANEDRTPVVAVFIQSLNEMIDLNAKRSEIALWRRIPDMLFVTLAFLTILVMVLTGYWLGWTARRHVFPTALLIITFATTYLLVIDLDRPHGGYFRVSKQPMIELSESMHATAELQSPNESAALPNRE